MQNKISVKSTDLVDPGAIANQSILRKLSNTESRLVDENSYLKFSKQFRNKQTLWKLRYNLIDRKKQIKLKY